MSYSFVLEQSASGAGMHLHLHGWVERQGSDSASQPCLRCTKTNKLMRWQERSGERDEAEYVGCDASVYGAVRGRDTMTRRCRWNGTERNGRKPNHGRNGSIGCGGGGVSPFLYHHCVRGDVSPRTPLALPAINSWDPLFFFLLRVMNWGGPPCYGSTAPQFPAPDMKAEGVFDSKTFESQFQWIRFIWIFSLYPIPISRIFSFFWNFKFKIS
jgi:hypothetical protein